MNTLDTLCEYYREYWNDYLTVAKWAEHKGISEEHARKLLPVLKEIREAHIADLKSLEIL